MRIVNMDVEVACDEDSRGVIAATDRKEENSSRKTEKGLANVKDTGGR